jgi:hypothetical protein
MASLSSCHVLMELEQIQVLNGVLDENIGEYSLDDDSVFDSDYTQLVTPETHMISDSEGDNDSDEQQENINVGLGEVSNKFVWQNIGSFPTSRETFVMCMIRRYDPAELDVVSAFETISDVALVRLIIDETNRYAQQEISKNVKSFTFCFRIRKWEDVTIDEMYVVLAVFMLMGIVQKSTFRSYYSKNWLLFIVFLF